MSSEKLPNRRPAIQTQRRRKRRQAWRVAPAPLGASPCWSAAERHQASRSQATQG